MTKRLIGTVMATVFAIASAWAVAEGTAQTAPVSKAVQMTDAELDEVTAAGALTANIILNAGNADVFKGDLVNTTHITCVNCSELGFVSPESGPAQGAHFVANRGLAKHGYPDGRLRCFGGFTLGVPGC
jgi:hypothetical protein